MASECDQRFDLAVLSSEYATFAEPTPQIVVEEDALGLAALAEISRLLADRPWEGGIDF